MKLKAKHLQVARLLIEKELSAERIAEEVKISGRQIRRWLELPQFKEFQELIDELLEVKINHLKRLIKNSTWRAIERLKEISECYEAEPARKACLNILQLSGEFKIQEENESSGNNQIVIIRAGEIETQAQTGTEKVSGRFRL